MITSSNLLNSNKVISSYRPINLAISGIIAIIFLSITFQSKVVTSTDTTNHPIEILHTTGQPIQNQSSAVKTSDILKLNGGKIDSNYCGYLLIETKPRTTPVDVLEGVTISPAVFNKIYDKFNVGSVVLLNDDCKIEICGYSSAAPTVGDIDYNKGHCKDFNESESPVDVIPYSYNYEITSISCACKKNRSLCENVSCSASAMHDFVQQDPKVCGVLYQETNCQDCFYDRIALHHEESFETINSAVIKSFLVRPGCVMELKTFGYLFFQSEASSIFYNESQTVVKPTYAKRGEEFLCKCDQIEADFYKTSRNEHKTTPSSISSSSEIHKMTTENGYKPQKSSAPILSVGTFIEIGTVLMISVISKILI